MSRGTRKPTAWDLVRQGTRQFHQITQPTHKRARERAVSPGRRSAIARGVHGLGRAKESIVGYGWSENPAANLREAVQSCLTATGRPPR